ncbi:MAG: hypothetical protein RL302_18 [Pseudomonadota bacterium]|jgi:hypothetical protein
MSPSTVSGKPSRIVSYKVPAETWVLCALILVAAGGLRFVADSDQRQIAEIGLFVLTLVNALNFFIPLATPNSILGGAKLKTLVLAAFALIGLISVH